MLFDSVISQCIDSNGKTRVLNFKHLSLLVSPLPVLNVPEVEISKITFFNIKNIENVLKFIKDTNLKIVEINGKFDQTKTIIRGLAVVSTDKSIIFGYIPMKTYSLKTEEISIIFPEELQNIPVGRKSDKYNIILSGISDLIIMKHNSKIATYLKEISIYECAQNPKKFGRENYIIDEDHVYNIENIEFENKLEFSRNNIFYRDSKIIAPDLDTIKRLIMFVKVSYLNDYSLFRRYRHKKIMKGSLFYNDVDDFIPEKNQLIFIDSKSIEQWKDKKLKNVSTVVYRPLSENIEPYYYRNIFIKNGEIMILQNTENGDYLSALAASQVWEKSEINPGYYLKTDSIILPESPSFKVYTAAEGITHESDTKSSEASPLLNIFGYEDGTYAAILFLKNEII